MKCEVGCGGEGDANVSACFAGDASRMSAAKKVPAPRGLQACRGL